MDAYIARKWVACIAERGTATTEQNRRPCSEATLDSPIDQLRHAVMIHFRLFHSGGAIFRQKSNRLLTPRPSGDTVGYAAETWRCLTLLRFIPSSKLRTTVTTLTSIQNLHKVELTRNPCVWTTPWVVLNSRDPRMCRIGEEVRATGSHPGPDDSG